MRKIFILLPALISILIILSLVGCTLGSSLSPNKPVTLTVWHVYGEHSESPMNILIDEFNNTVGKEKGIVLDVTSITNSNDIGNNLLDSFNDVPGSAAMPDLFFCHPNNATALGVDNLLNWNDYFTEQELNGYVEPFVKEGAVGKKLIVFPVSKSTQILFLNNAQFMRFAKDTNHSYTDLSTWEGFYSVAEDYYEWSNGSPFCAIDFPVTLSELEAMSTGSYIRKENWVNSENKAFQKSWFDFCEANVKGHVVISDMYSNTQVMTGEVCAGIGSSAAILYYNDTVTYPNKKTEALELVPLPVPQTPGGEDCVLQAGVGLCALKTTDQKAEAASIFAHWLTETERNLDFVVSAGYMPVTHSAYDIIPKYEFNDDAQKLLYSSFSKIRNSCDFVVIHDSSSSYAKTDAVYNLIRSKQSDMHNRYLKGEDATDLAKEYMDLCFPATK